MEISVSQLPHARVKVIVTLSPAEMDPFLDAAAARISQQLKIEGFRPGKAPRQLVEQRVGVMEVYKEAIDALVQKTYPQAVVQKDLRVVGSPEINVEKLAPGNPVVYNAEVALLPTVQLGDLRSTKIDHQPVSITLEEIDHTFDELRRMQAKEVLHDKVAETGDKLEINLQVFLDNVPVEGGSSQKLPIELGAGMFIPGFEEKVAGMKANDEREFSLTFPKEYHDKKLADKEATFKVKAMAVYKIDRPAADDAFAKSVGKFQTIAELKKKLEENLRADKENKERQRHEIAVLEAAVEKTTFSEIPAVMVEHELDRMVEELEQSLQQQGGSFEDYLQHIKKSKEDLRQEWQAPAEKRVKTALLIAEVISQEKITVPEVAIDTELETAKKMYAEQPEIQKQLEALEYRSYMRSVLQNRKAVDFLVKHALGEDPTKPVIKDGKTESGIIVGSG